MFLRQKAKEFGGKAYVAPIDVYFDERNVPQPDVIWLAPDTKCEMVGTQRLCGAPELIAEVLLPSTASTDRKEKFMLLDVYEVGETFTSALIGAVEVAVLFTS